MATHSSLRNVVSDCHRLLEECCDLQALTESGWAQCRLAELKLWCDNVGVFAEHKNSLGYRLRLYPHVMEALYSSLLALRAVLYECHESGKLVSLESTSFETDCVSAPGKSSDDTEPDVESTDACPDDGTDDGHEWSFSSWSDQEDVEELSPYGSPDGQSRSRSVLTEHCESVGLMLGQLLEIGCLIRRSGHASRLSRADASFKQSSHPHLRQHLQLLLRQRNLISFSLFPEVGRGITTQGIEQMLGCDNTHPNREREPPIDTTLRVEQIQLINANLIRRHRFEFFRKRAAQLREPQTRERPVGEVMTGVQRNVTSKSNAEPRDGNLIDEFPSKNDTYIQGDSTLAASSTISVGQNSASTVDPAILLPNDGKIPQAKPINYAPSTQLTQTGMKLVYPSPPPKSFPRQSTFTCPCCHELFNYPNAGSERLWRKHVKDDLCPYNCPVQGCPSSDVLFRKKTEWQFHLVKSHEIVSHWECLICEDQDRFTEYSGFLSHLQLEHEGFVEEKHLRSVADMCSQKRLDLPVLCPVCNSPQGEADERFVDHLAECIHGFSLLALPSAMVKRTPTLTYQATDEVQQWIEATDTLANDSFQHSELPQSAVEDYRQEGEPVVDWKQLILYSTTRATKGTPSASDHSAEAHGYFGDTRESCSSDSGDALFRFGESLNRKRGLLQRICDVDYHEQYLYLLNQHEAGSGNWFLQDPTFQHWMETKDATLFCPGLPGAGKTIMTAIVVDHLLQTKHAADHPVAFVFCRTEQQHVQSMEHILASILRQVVDIQSEIPSIVQDFQESRAKEGPAFGETERALQSALRNLRGLSIVFDALNECAPDVRHQIPKTIESLRQRCDVRFMMTTRLPLDTELLSVYRSKPTLEIKAYVSSHASSQPDYEPPVYDLRRWIVDHMVGSFDVKTGDKLPHGFMPSGLVENYLQEGNYKRTVKVLTAIFREQPSFEAKDVAEICPRVFCILLLIGKARYVGPFTQYNDLADHRLPFATEPPGFPTSSDDPDFFAAFYEKQWSFCAPKLTSRATPQRWQDQYIMPFTQLTRVGGGGSAIVYKAVLRMEHDKLSNHPVPGGCYAIKTFRTRTSAENDYQREVRAFKQITEGSTKSTQGIIKFFGSFEYRKSFNIILEFADGGTLEDYFADQSRPSNGRDILSFWQNILETINALHSIHENHLHPYSRTKGTLLQGWHQDLKPTNILVVKSRSDNPYQWSFKVADLGLSHFKTIMVGDREAADLDAFGTKTYGAPECYALTDFTATSKNIVKRSIDIWSLGAILSEAAVWVVKGRDAVGEYRNQRKAETDRQPDFRDGSCFHNGKNRLRAVDKWHKDLRAEMHPEDFITHQVIDIMIVEMLDPNEAARPGTQQLDSKKQRIIATAKENLDDSTIGSQATSAGRQSQLIPPTSLPARIRTSSGLASSGSRPISGAPSNYYASPTQSMDQVLHPWEDAVPDAISSTPIQEEPEDMYLPQNDPGPVMGAPGPAADQKGPDRNPGQPYCSTAEAWEWWKKMKYESETAKLPHHDNLMYQLRGRDHVFIVDDSRSMAQYWTEVERLINLLAYITKTRDPDGVELYFLSSEKKYISAKASELAAIVNKWTPNKRTDLSTRLDAVFRKYYDKMDSNKTSRRKSFIQRKSTGLRKLSIYVLTDGVWEIGDEEQDCSCIKLMTSKLHEMNYLREQIGIQFISFGSTQAGLSRLERLANLNQARGIARDIIDIEPSNGNVWKMLLGAINSVFDND